MLAAVAIWKGSSEARILALCSLVGTGLLVSQTAYLRYWLPGLWLAALAGSGLADRLRLRSSVARSLLAFAALAVVLPPVLLFMLNFWQDPRGWPWDVYTGRISRRAYLERQYPGFEQADKMTVFGSDWPKAWFTGLEGAGHLQVQPMEATVWEISLHANEPRSKIQYLATAGCQYWIVNEESTDAYWVKAIGISQFFWNEDMAVARAWPVTVYRMRPVEDALRDFDARATPGTDLVMDGGFETGERGTLRFWRPSGDAAWAFPFQEAMAGKGALRLAKGGGVRQDVALPPGVQAVEFTAAARSCAVSGNTGLRYRLTVSGFDRDLVPGRPKDWIEPYQPLSSKQAVVTLGGDWRIVRESIPIPPRARYVTILLDEPDTAGGCFIDEVHLYSK